MKIKIFSLILVCLMLLPMIIACNKEETPENGGDATSAETTPEVTEPLDEKILLVSGGKTDYILIRSEFVSEAFQSKFLDFSEKFRKESDSYIKLLDDFLRKDIDKSAPFEILFGAVDRDECRQVYATIDYDGYAIKHVGNKIVIAANTTKAMTLAVKAFFNECIEITTDDAGNKNVYFVKEVVCAGTAKTFFNETNPISDYKIVYAPGEKEAAEALVKLIKKYTYRELEIVSDTSAPTAKEILLGETNREESKTSTSASKIGFAVKAVGTKIVIRTGNGASLLNSVPVIATNYMLTSPEFNFPANVDASHTSYEGLDKAELVEGADFRIMSFNILSEEWTAEAKDMDKRIPGVIGAILYYEPDVIGIQEVSVKWYGILQEYLGDTYEFVNTDADNKKNGCYTGLAYNKNTVELLNKELYYYSVYNSRRLRVINMGHFRLTESGKTFIVTDTHFNANHKDATTENKNRVQQATEFIQKIAEYRTKYNCPIIMTGDYNSKDGSDPYNKVLSDTLIAEAKYTATTKGAIFRTYHNLGTMPPTDAESIDHIFYTGAITPLYYTTLVDQYLVIASDHCPIFADFKFN